MAQFPLGIVINKEKLFIFYNGKTTEINTPKLDAIIPEGRQDSMKPYGYRGKPKLLDLHSNK